MAVQVLNLILSLFNSVLSWFFSAEIMEGVSLGWIFITVIIMFMLIKFFLKGDNDG